MFKKLVRRVGASNKCVFICLVEESNLFIRHFYLIFNPPIFHSTWILELTCILLDVHIASWYASRFMSPYPMHNEHFFTHVLRISQKIFLIVIFMGEMLALISVDVGML
jgi:hypothetical protein